MRVSPGPASLEAVGLPVLCCPDRARIGACCPPPCTTRRRQPPARHPPLPPHLWLQPHHQEVRALRLALLLEVPGGLQVGPGGVRCGARPSLCTLSRDRGSLQCQSVVSPAGGLAPLDMLNPDRALVMGTPLQEVHRVRAALLLVRVWRLELLPHAPGQVQQGELQQSAAGVPSA